MDLREHCEANGVVWLESQGISAPGGVAHGFSTRLGGVSTGIYASLNLGHTRGDEPDAVRENYRRFLAATGAGRAEDMVISHQVHKDNVRVCTLADRGKGLDLERDYDADGMTSTALLTTVLKKLTDKVFYYCCFLTHSDVTDAMRAQLGSLAEDYIRPVTGEDRFHVDLKGINAALLRQAGVVQVDISTDCTGCLREKYWNHRTTGQARGSMAAVIMLK